MRLLFLDTSAWFASLDPRESRHGDAARAFETAIDQGFRFTTTHLVIAEMHALALRRLGTRFAARFLDAALDPTAQGVFPIDDELVQDAVDRWIRRHRDHSFSIADAVSFEVMRREDIDTAFALDHHFTVAGFQTIP